MHETLQFKKSCARGLRKGQKIQIPGEEISYVISKLWKLDLFSDINFYVKSVKGDKIELEIEIEELPYLHI